jgi:hypothetical protein
LPWTHDFLRKQLTGNGKRWVSEIFADGKQLGFSEKQLRGAAKRLDVAITNSGFGGSKKWWWQLKRAA